MLAEEDHETNAGAVAKRAISQFCKRDDMRCTSVYWLTTFVLPIDESKLD